MSFYSGGNLENSSGVRPGGRGTVGTGGTFILNGYIPSGKPLAGAGII